MDYLRSAIISYNISQTQPKYKPHFLPDEPENENEVTHRSSQDFSIWQSKYKLGLNDTSVAAVAYYYIQLCSTLVQASASSFLGDKEVKSLALRVPAVALAFWC